MSGLVNPLLDIWRAGRFELRLCQKRTMADIDAALVQQVLDISKRQWKPDVHHYR